jgi:hypothetical protein
MSTRRAAEAFARLLDDPAESSADSSAEGLADSSRTATGADLSELVTLARAIPVPQVAPDPEFVARLRVQLVAEAEQRASTRARTTARTTSRPSHARSAPRTLVIRWPRGVLPVAVATVLGFAVLLGGLASRALPGDRLYDVKLGIGQAQVRLAGSDQARGKALLNQVDHRLDEVDALVAAGDPSSVDVNAALDRAAVDLARAQRVLLAGSDGHADPQSLQTLADATAQASGRLRALAPLLPTASGPALHRLQDLLAIGTSALRQQALACGSPCADVRRQLEAEAGTTSGTSSGTGPVGALTNPLPTSPVQPTGGATASRPGGAGGSGTGNGAGSGAGATAGLPGVTVTVPGVGVTVPGVGVTTAPGGAPSVTVPPVQVTLGPVTASVSTSGCVIGLGGLCVGLPTK